MTDHEELLARIRQRISIIENELASDKTPTNIKNFAHRCLYDALGSLETFSMFERTLWVADQIVHLHNKAEAARIENITITVTQVDPDETDSDTFIVDPEQNGGE